MALSCFDNFIGLRGYCTATPSISGDYINTLPGISLKMIANLSTEDAASFKEVWDDIYSFAVSSLESDCLVHMQKYFKTNILLENALSGYHTVPQVAEVASAKKKGTAIELWGSKNTVIFVNNIELWLKTAINSNIQIWDYDHNVLLDTIAFTGVAGFNQIQINKKYDIKGQRKWLYISFDGSLSDTQQTVSTSDCFYLCNFTTRYATVRGAQIDAADPVLKNNMEFSGNSHGMVVNFNVQCDIGNFICSNRDLLKTPLMWKLGESIMMERINSDRLNFYTMVNSEQAQELANMYGAKYVQTLNATLENLNFEGDAICFPCEKEVMYKINLP